MRSNLTWWIFRWGILIFQKLVKFLTNDPGIQGVYQKPNSVIFLVHVDFFIAEVATFDMISWKWHPNEGKLTATSCLWRGVKVILVGHLARVTGSISTRKNREGLESFNKNRTVWQLYPFGGGFEASLLEEQFRSSKIHQDCGSVENVSGGLGKPRYERQWKKGRTWYFSCSNCRPRVVYR